MKFSEIIKNEIVQKPHKTRELKRAFLAGIVRGTGSLYEKDGYVGLEFKVFGEQTAELVSSYLKSLFSYEIRELSVAEDRLNKKDKYVINVFGDEVEYILKELDVLREEKDGYKVNFDFYESFNGNENFIKAFISGLFLSSGSCTVPTKNENKNTRYHLEIVFNHNVPAYQTMSTLLKYGVTAKIINRKDNFVLYIKSVEEIKNFLAFLPAPISMLKLTDLSINREISNVSNRQKNCDIGNVNRQLEAAEKQLKAIKIIEENVGLNYLKPDLLQVAIARKENPDETVLELAERLNLTKSCINHRLRKILEISKEIK